MPRVMPDAGDRNRAVTIQQLTEDHAESRYVAELWPTLIATYWCSREDVGGREKFHADQLSSPYDTRWVGGYREDMDPELVDVPKKRRLVYQGREHDIVAANIVSHGDQVRAGIELLTLARNG
jgi:hypothetical protein